MVSCVLWTFCACKLEILFSKHFALETNIIEFSGERGNFKLFLDDSVEPGRYQTTINLRGFGHSAYDQRSLRIEAIVSQSRITKLINPDFPTFLYSLSYFVSCYVYPLKRPLSARHFILKFQVGQSPPKRYLFLTRRRTCGVLLPKLPTQPLSGKDYHALVSIFQVFKWAKNVRYEE